MGPSSCAYCIDSHWVRITTEAITIIIIICTKGFSLANILLHGKYKSSRMENP